MSRQTAKISPISEFVSTEKPSFPTISFSSVFYRALNSIVLAILIIIVFPTALFAKTDISVSAKYYEFAAHDRQSIWRGIKSQSPKVSKDDHAKHKIVVGLTEWSLRYNYRYSVALYRCEIKDFLVRADIAIHLPHWKDKWKASETLQKSWDKYVRMVSDHEDIHKTYAVRTAERIDKDVSALGVKKGCGELKEEVDAIVSRHMDQNRMDNRWFDAKENIYQKNAAWF